MFTKNQLGLSHVIIQTKRMHRYLPNLAFFNTALVVATGVFSAAFQGPSITGACVGIFGRPWGELRPGSVGCPGYISFRAPKASRQNVFAEC